MLFVFVFSSASRWSHRYIINLFKTFGSYNQKSKAELVKKKFKLHKNLYILVSSIQPNHKVQGKTNFKKKKKCRLTHIFEVLFRDESSYFMFKVLPDSDYLL